MFSDKQKFVDQKMPRRKITRTEWLDIAKELFDTPNDMVFRCISCGHKQSINSAKEAGVDVSRADTWIFFACEGRHRNAVGCNWSLGGLFRLHTLEVIDDRPESDGKSIPAFDFATASVLGERVEAEQ